MSVHVQQHRHIQDCFLLGEHRNVDKTNSETLNLSQKVNKGDVKIQCSFPAGGWAMASLYFSLCIKHNVGIGLTDLSHLICDFLFFFFLFAHKLQMASLKQKHDHRERIKHAAAT